MGSENLQTRLGNSAVLKNYSLLFGLSQERHIRTDGVVLTFHETGG
jgi:hypothetical protein